MTSNDTRPDAIHVDVIGDKDGGNRVRTLGTASILGILPGGHMWTVATGSREAECCGTFHVDVEGQTTHIRCVTTGHTILSGRGLVKTLQTMADITNTPVIVSHDPGASSTIKNAEYTPSGEFAPVAEAAPVAEVEHAYARTSMLCGAPIDQGRGTTRMEWVTCEPCKGALIVRTADGVVVLHGLAVWDYDLNVGTVDASSMTSDGWFNVVNASGERMSLMNGERVVTRHPFTRQTAVDALAPVAEVDQYGHCTNGKCGACPCCVDVATVTEDAPGFDEAMAEAEAEDIEYPTNAEVDAMMAEHDQAMNAWAAPLLRALGVTEAEIWHGTGTMIKRPIRTNLGRRARKSARRARRGIKGGM